MSAAFDFDALESALYPTLDPRVYVEPKDGADVLEFTRQSAWVAHMRKHNRRVLVFAVRNGAHIPSHKGRQLAKSEGLHSGFPDTGAVWTGATAYLEWKDGRGEPKPAQIECLNRLVAMDHPCAIVRTVDGACRWLHEIGAPVPAIRQGL